MSDGGSSCGNANNQVDFFGLRVGSLFVIWATSTVGAVFPILTARSKRFSIPRPAYEFAKYFGSGVIIATAFIHLLDPAIQELGNTDCLGGTWALYPWAEAIAMASVFTIFFVELAAFRLGSATLAKIGKKAYDPHAHALGELGHHGAHGPEIDAAPDADEKVAESSLEEGGVKPAVLDNGVTQILGIAILEFGILFHSVLIGLTLAVDPDFKVLFVVLVFHQMFEGLGLGARLAFMELAPGYEWVPLAGGILYAVATPIGIGAGLGIRTTYNPDSTIASIVSGVFDAISAGILLYTGLVELLAHEFLFNPTINTWSNKKLVFSGLSMLTGAGIMALLGRWA